MNEDMMTVVLLDDACLTVEQVASACAVHVDWVAGHVQDGVLSVTGATSVEWRFSSQDLRRARRIRALERDFDAAPELAALVADLIDEVETLKRRLRRAGLE